MDEARSEGPSHLLEHINRMRTLMGLGWMRRMLRAAADEARERGYRRIDIEQIVNIDPLLRVSSCSCLRRARSLQPSMFLRCCS